MTKESVLALLRQQGDYLSGQEMSRQLGLSRAAVWKAVQALRDDGYEIASVTNRGYKLVEHSAPLCRDEVLRALGDHPWADRVTVLDTVDSTNTMAKKLAAEGAPPRYGGGSQSADGGPGPYGAALCIPLRRWCLSDRHSPACRPAQRADASDGRFGGSHGGGHCGGHRFAARHQMDQ